MGIYWQSTMCQRPAATYLLDTLRCSFCPQAHVQNRTKIGFRGINLDSQSKQARCCQVQAPSMQRKQALVCIVMRCCFRHEEFALQESQAEPDRSLQVTRKLGNMQDDATSCCCLAIASSGDADCTAEAAMLAMYQAQPFVSQCLPSIVPSARITCFALGRDEKFSQRHCMGGGVHNTSKHYHNAMSKAASSFMPRILAANAGSSGRR